MKNLYVISYSGGMFGEFIGGQLSRDTNFHDAASFEPDTSVNRYSYRDIIMAETNINIDSLLGTSLESRRPWPLLTNETRHCSSADITAIKQLLSTKNICSLTHWNLPKTVINLPNVKRVKFYMEEKDAPFAFIMQLYKSQLMFDSFNLGTRQDLLDVLKSASLPDHSRTVLKAMNTRTPLTLTDFFMLLTGFQNSPQLVIDGYQNWLKDATDGVDHNTHDPNQIYLNPFDLLQDPELHMDKWVNALGLSKSLDTTALKKYHTGNLKIYKEIMGQDFSDGISSDWNSTFSNFIDTRLLLDSSKRDNNA